MSRWFDWPDDIDPPTTFQVIWGLVVPLLALIFDPIVFRNRLGLLSDEAGLFERFRVGGYLALGGSILAYAIILCRPPRTLATRTLTAGLLCGATLTAYGFGLALVPFSILGLIFIIGILGVIPFLAAWAYQRIAVQLLRFGLPGWYGRRQFWLGLLLMLVVPLGGQVYATRRIDSASQALIAGQPERRQEAIASLRSAFWCSLSCYDQLVLPYMREGDPDRKVALADAYREITGGSLEMRRRLLYYE